MLAAGPHLLSARMACAKRGGELEILPLEIPPRQLLIRLHPRPRTGAESCGPMLREQNL